MLPERNKRFWQPRDELNGSRIRPKPMEVRDLMTFNFGFIHCKKILTYQVKMKTLRQKRSSRT